MVKINLTDGNLYAKQLNGEQVSSTSVPVTVPVGKVDLPDDLKEKLEILNISDVEYLKLCESNSEFAMADVIRQSEIVAEARRTGILVDNTELVEQHELTTTLGETEEHIHVNNKGHNHSTEIDKSLLAFTEYNYEDALKSISSVTGKPDVDVAKVYDQYYLEFAKNLFLYGGEEKRTIEDWYKLSEDEINKLIEDVRSSSTSNIYLKNFNKRIAEKQNRRDANKNDEKEWGRITNSISREFVFSIQKLQAANYKEMTLEEFDRLSDEEQESALHEILCANNNLTENQLRRLENSENVAKALKHFLRKNHCDVSEYLSSEHSGHSEEALEGHVHVTDINRVLEAYNKAHNPSVDISIVLEEYYKDMLTELENTKDQSGSEKIDEIRRKHDYWKKYNNSDAKKIINNPELAKQAIKKEGIDTAKYQLLEEIRSKYSSFDYMDQKDQLIIIQEVLSEKFKTCSDSKERVNMLICFFDQLLSDEDKSNDSLIYHMYGALLRDEKYKELGDELSQRFTPLIQALNSDHAREFNDTQLENMQRVQKQYTESDDPVYRDLGNLFAINTMENALDWQNAHLSEGYAKWDSQEVQEYHAKTALEMLSRNKEYANKMLNNVTQYSSEETLLYAADQIKDLEPSAQLEALNHIYESGNQDAIDKAIENLADVTKTPLVIQEAETPRLFEKIIVKSVLDDVDLANLDLTQQLSSVQVASLAPADKQKYYMNMFVQASSTDKIKILEKLPNGTQKKTIFTTIARFVPNLLSSMVDAGMGVMMLSSNLPMDASSKVLQAMIKSENPDVKKQVADLINDKDYHERIQDILGSKDNRVLKNEREKALENYHMSLPQDFMRANDITPEEMQRMQKTMWLLDQAGRFKA